MIQCKLQTLLNTAFKGDLIKRFILMNGKKGTSPYDLVCPKATIYNHRLWSVVHRHRKAGWPRSVHVVPKGETDIPVWVWVVCLENSTGSEKSIGVVVIHKVAISSAQCVVCRWDVHRVSVDALRTAQLEGARSFHLPIASAARLKVTIQTSIGTYRGGGWGCGRGWF